MNTSAKVAQPSQIGMARILAQAHADAGLDLFNRLQDVSTRSRQRTQHGDYLEHLRLAIPAVTCLSLAAEQFLKVIHAKRFGAFQQGHDLMRLFDGLPPESRSALEKDYAGRYARLESLAVEHFGLTAATDLASMPIPTVPSFTTLRGALEHLRLVFQDWRYIYEEMALEHNLGIHFKALIVLIEVCRAHAAGQTGTGAITFGRADL